jgi:hypothetical protein
MIWVIPTALVVGLLVGLFLRGACVVAAGADRAVARFRCRDPVTLEVDPWAKPVAIATGLHLEDVRTTLRAFQDLYILGMDPEDVLPGRE